MIFAVREAMKHLGIDSKISTAAIQGFGNVAQYAAIAFREMLGGAVKCVSCYDQRDRKSYTYSNHDIDPHFLQTITDEYGSIDKTKAAAAGYTIEEGDAWLCKDVDVLIPAALEGQINAETAKCINPNVKIETVESVQNDMNYYWEKEEVLQRLDQKMTSAFYGVLNMAQDRQVYMRDAAYLVAIDRVVRAMRFRGWV